jgi:hypothetical protein
MASQNKQVNEFSISGRLLKICPPEEFTTRNGQTKITRLIIMEVLKGNYINEVSFELGQKVMSMLGDIKDGDWITVTFLLNATKSERDGKTRYYPKLEVIALIKG